MRVTFILFSLVVTTCLGADELKVVAEHSGGGFTQAAHWRVRIADDRIGVFTPEPARNGTFAMTDEERRQLVSLLNETRFFALNARYGAGDMEGNSCTMTIGLGGQKSTVTLMMYSKKKPPSDAESSELQRAFRVWDALKTLGRLADLRDDCRREFDLWEIKP